MRKFTFLSILILTIVRINAQNYQISFAGTGTSNSIDSVKIENISQCTDTSIAGNNILNLSSNTGISENNILDNVLNVYPNPIVNTCLIGFNASSQGNTTIELDDITGKKIIQLTELLQEGHHVYCLSGVSTGVYFLKVQSANYSYSSKIISLNAESGIAAINHVSIASNTDKKMAVKLKGVQGVTTINMQYNTGDTLKITGKSDNNRTIIMLKPTQSQKVTFTFVNCADADSNHYAVVQIGTQLWMEQNLKTTKYRDGSSLTNPQDSATWRNTTLGGYCDYHNQASEGTTYGHLYNYYAVSDVRNIAPVGWHIPSDSEWTVLSTYVGGDIRAGRMLKESCNTRWQFLADSCGINHFGFTALCANYRVTTGAWSLAPNNNHDCGFWTSTIFSNGFTWARMLRWCYGDLWKGPAMYNTGYCIRCVKD